MTSSCTRVCVLVVAAVMVVLSLPAQSVMAQTNMSVHARVVVSPNPDLDTIALVDFPFTLRRYEFSFYRPDSTDPHYEARISAQVNVYGSVVFIVLLIGDKYIPVQFDCDSRAVSAL